MEREARAEGAFRFRSAAEGDASERGSWLIRQESRVKVEISLGGCIARCHKLDMPTWYEGDGVRGKKGAITEFSPRSRANLLRTVAGIRSDLLPILVTLTYPGEFPKDPRRWKRDLDAFGKALRRESAGVSMVWKLEPQERGAPHYHGMIWGVEWVSMEWLRETWFRIVGSEDVRHLWAGTRVERAYSSRAAMVYASKRYMGKATKIPDWWEGVGRVWGIIGRKALPVAPIAEFEVAREHAAKFRRAMERWLLVKRRGKSSATTRSYFTGKALHVARLLSWAQGSVVDQFELRGARQLP